MIILDLSKHRYRSQDGRHWSSLELCDFTDGKITEDQMRRLTSEYWYGSGGKQYGHVYLPPTAYVPQAHRDIL